MIPILLLFVLLAAPAAQAQTSKNVTLLAHLNQHPGYSACWSYVHPDGREYAILGATDGTSIVNVTDPAASHEVAFIPGEPSQWREMKQSGAAMRVRFIAQDQPPEGIVEAGVDDFEFYDAGTATAIGPPPAPAAMSVSAPTPNPAAHLTTFLLSLPAEAQARVAVYDAAGREVRVLYDRSAGAGFTPLFWDGKDSRGRSAASGVYWIRALSGGKSFERKVVWVR